MKVGIEVSASILQNLSARLKDSSSINNSSFTSAPNSIKSEAQALKAIGTDDAKNIAAMKSIVKGYDFTSITQKELSELSVKLYNSDLIDLDTASKLALGDANFRENGSQITDLKFNALEHFSKDFNNQKNWASSATGAEGIYNAKAEIAKTQKAVGVLFSLSYFTNSEETGVGVNVKA